MFNNELDILIPRVHRPGSSIPRVCCTDRCVNSSASSRREREGEVGRGDRTGAFGAVWGRGLSFGLICWCSGLFTEVRGIGETASHDHVRTAPNPTLPSWKAGWDCALTTSSPVSSADVPVPPRLDERHTPASATKCWASASVQSRQRGRSLAAKSHRAHVLRDLDGLSVAMKKSPLVAMCESPVVAN